MIINFRTFCRKFRKEPILCKIAFSLSSAQPANKVRKLKLLEFYGSRLWVFSVEHWREVYKKKWHEFLISKMRLGRTRLFSYQLDRLNFFVSKNDAGPFSSYMMVRTSLSMFALLCENGKASAIFSRWRQCSLHEAIVCLVRDISSQFARVDDQKSEMTCYWNPAVRKFPVSAHQNKKMYVRAHRAAAKNVASQCPREAAACRVIKHRKLAAVIPLISVFVMVIFL